MSTLPSDFDTLMADDIRQEIGGKVTLVGFFIGNEIVLPKDAKPGPDIALAKLAFLTRLKDGDGTWNGKWSISGPGNIEIIKSPKDFSVKKVAGEMHGVLTVLPLKVPKVGDYKYVLELDDRPYEYRFHIK